MDTAKTEETPASTSASTPGHQRDEEIDVWWGAYSGWAMLPSLLVCIALTGLIGWFTWATFRGGRSGVVQLTFLGLAGSVWLFQTLRWIHRSMTYTYRLTTRRLFRDRGFVAGRRLAVELTRIRHVIVKRAFHERLVGVGRVCLYLDDNPRRPLVLDGVRQPDSVAELIRVYAQQARSP